jgi:hypothetical protein
MTNTENAGNPSNGSKYFKNKVTKEIAEYDSVMGLFYIIGDKSYTPLSTYQIVGDPTWQETDEPVAQDDPITSIRKKFFSWINLK